MQAKCKVYNIQSGKLMIYVRVSVSKYEYINKGTIK